MFHRVEFRTFAHATEDEGRVRAALAFATGGAPMEGTATQGFHGNPITILEAELHGDPAIRGFWERLAAEDQLDAIKGQLDQRLDDGLVLHLRLDKQEAFGERLRVVEHDDVIVVRAKVAAYPAKRERALPAVDEYLEGVRAHAAH